MKGEGETHAQYGRWHGIRNRRLLWRLRFIPERPTTRAYVWHWSRGNPRKSSGRSCLPAWWTKRKKTPNQQSATFGATSSHSAITKLAAKQIIGFDKSWSPHCLYPCVANPLLSTLTYMCTYVYQRARACTSICYVCRCIIPPLTH